jgi:hypothetical protein
MSVSSTPPLSGGTSRTFSVAMVTWSIRSARGAGVSVSESLSVVNRMYDSVVVKVCQSAKIDPAKIRGGKATRGGQIYPRVKKNV